MKKYAYSLLILLSLNLYAANPNVAPDEAGTKFFDSNTIQTKDGGISERSELSDKELIYDDTLPNEKINRGLNYSENLGVSGGKKILTPQGGSVYVKKRPDGTIPNASNVTEDDIVKDIPKEKSYEDHNKKYEEFVMNQDKLDRNKKEKEIQRSVSKEVFKAGNTVSENMSRFMDGENISSGSNTVTNIMTTNTQNKSLTNEELFQREQDATKLYSEGYSLDPTSAHVDNLKNKNYGALSKAYQSIDETKKALTNRLTKGSIKCQVSRQLIPSYRCPIEGKSGLLYPSGSNIDLIRKVNTEEAKKQCNDECWTDPGALSCVNKKVLPNDKLNTGFNGTLIVAPNWNSSTSVVTFPASDMIPVEYVKFKFEIKHNPEKSEMTADEWEEFLYLSGFKIRLSVLESNTKLSGDVKLDIVDRMVVNLRSSIVEVDIPVNRVLSEITVKFWEPYISDNYMNKAKDTLIFEELFNKYGASIIVTRMESKYTSDSYHFCQAKQMVSHPNECVGGKIEVFESGDNQIHYLCSADSKKIGPEPKWGAFYSAESCEDNCVIQKPCEATYGHYNSYGNSQFMFKSEFTCVDEEDNSSCSPDLCKAHFADINEMPLNEIVTYNDDNFVYTVRNKVAMQNVERPKIDMSMEMSSSIDYDLLFQQEQKDSAYLYMLNNLTYNRITYRLGTESPFNMAYIKESAGGRTALSVKLKPASFDIDSGKTFYMYSVLKVEHSFKPIAGAWYLNESGGITADPENSSIQFQDISYAVKTGDVTNPWKVFKREEFAKILTVIKTISINEDGTTRTNTHTEWLNSDQYKINAFGQYDQGSDIFNNIDKNQKAEHFMTDMFKSNKEFYIYQLSDFLEKDLVDSKGLLIKSQMAINHDTSFRKLYNVKEESRLQSWPKNHTLFYVYSDKKLSYHDLMVKIEGDKYETSKELSSNNKHAIYELLNPRNFKSDEIKYDSEINNNIKTLIKGTADKTSVFVDWEPSISEKGKKVFKFLFLYDDTEKKTFEYEKN